MIRLGLFLRDRAALAPGERVAIIASLRPELAVAEFAAVALGATSLAIDPTLGGDELALALTAAAPAVVILEKASARERIGSAQRAVVALDGKPRDGWSWSEALDLGGTLDTPERAQSFRARAREVPASAPALGQVVARDGAVQCHFIDHGDAAARLNRIWADVPPAKGDVTYLAGPVTLGARIACISAVLDGVTRCAFGTPQSESVDFAELRPRRIVAPPGVVERARRTPAPPRSTTGWRVLDWLKGRTESTDRKS